MKKCSTIKTQSIRIFKFEKYLMRCFLNFSISISFSLQFLFHFHRGDSGDFYSHLSLHSIHIETRNKFLNYLTFHSSILQPISQGITYFYIFLNPESLNKFPTIIFLTSLVKIDVTSETRKIENLFWPYLPTITQRRNVSMQIEVEIP